MVICQQLGVMLQLSLSQQIGDVAVICQQMGDVAVICQQIGDVAVICRQMGDVAVICQQGVMLQSSYLPAAVR